MGQHFEATPFLIAGPCVVEADELNRRVGEALAELGTKLGVHVIYKGSFDKANRSRLKGARGPGLERGLQALATVRSETGLPILTDVHDAGQVLAAAQVADVLQIPAFLCRQTDLLVAAGRAGHAVNVKKGQWLSPDGMQGAVEKVRAGGAPEVAVTERGTFFGYGDLVVDMRNFARLRAACGVPLLYAAAAAGADGFFLETHPDPDRAPSDGPNMLPLDQLPAIVSVALEVWQRARGAVVRATPGVPAPHERRPRQDGLSMIDAALARRLKLVGFDVDGVLTDNGVYLGMVGDHPVEFKRCHIQDGLGIKFLREAGLTVVLVSARRSDATDLRARELKVDEVVQDKKKLPAFAAILERHGVGWEESAFVGDGLPDLPLLERVGLP